jgi:hypothetical protein
VQRLPHFATTRNGDYTPYIDTRNSAQTIPPQTTGILTNWLAHDKTPLLQYFVSLPRAALSRVSQYLEEENKG